jgi:predicted acetyltransferase
MSAPSERSPGSVNGRMRPLNGATNGRLPHGMSAPSRDAACVRELADGARIVSGNAGDHPLVLQLLVEARHAPLGEDFQSRIDEPTYRPGDRLLVRRERSLVAHVHVTSLIGWFEGQRVPLVKFEDFAALPEFGHAGYDGELLESAESIAASEGAVLAIAHAESPEHFLRRGWSVLRGQGLTRASARGVLAHLDAQEAARRKARRKPPLAIRTWRHFELDAIRDVYDAGAAELWGPLLRSEAAWQWVVGRKAQDQILIAVDIRDASPDDSARDLLNAGGRVVGYAVVRGSLVIEMMSLPDFPGARTQLLARACQDAMDRDHQTISLNTPAADPLHELLVTAGGAWIGDGASGNPRWLVKLLSAEKWVERFYAAWHERARVAGVARPLEIGFVADGLPYRFTLTRRSSRFERSDELPTARVECSRATLESLLFGNLSVPVAVAHDRIRLSHPELAADLAAIFAPRLFWQSALESMRL